MDKIFISEKTFKKHMGSLVFEISKSYDFDEVISIRTGGVYIGESIAGALNIPHKTIHISFYEDGIKQETPKVYDTPTLSPDKTYLICDDLIDSGSTIEYIKEKYPNINMKTAVILQNKNCKLKADYFADYYSGKKWVVFPWEPVIPKYHK